MNPAFLRDDLWEDFKRELLSWEGTPYRHLQMEKKRGVDCTLLFCTPLLKAKIFRRVSIPEYYPRNWWTGSADLIVDNFEKNFNENSEEGYVWIKGNGVGNVRGDIELFSFHKSRKPHHSAVLMEDNTIYHCTPKKAATTVVFTPKLRKFCVAHFRLMEK